MLRINVCVKCYYSQRSAALICFELGLIYRIFTGSRATEIFINALMETLIRINRAEDSPLTTRTALLADVSDK